MPVTFVGKPHKELPYLTDLRIRPELDHRFRCHLTANGYNNGFPTDFHYCPHCNAWVEEVCIYEEVPYNKYIAPAIPDYIKRCRVCREDITFLPPSEVKRKTEEYETAKSIVANPDSRPDLIEYYTEWLQWFQSALPDLTNDLLISYALLESAYYSEFVFELQKALSI